MKKNCIIIFIGIIGVLGILLTYKIYAVNKYSTKNFKRPDINIKEPLTISNKKIDDADYFKVDNIMIKNDFKEFRQTSDNDDRIKTYSLYDENNKLKAGIKFIEYVTYIEGLKDVSILSGDPNIKGKDITSFMKSHEFKNDFEFIKYLSNLKEEKVTIFTSINKMKDNYTAYYLASNLLPKGNYKEILGDYTGYLIETEYDTVSVNIVNSDKLYIIEFTKLDYFTEDYIKELISTIKVQ